MVDILAIGSHPDDIEFAIGGVLAKAVSDGQSVAICDLTLGEMGTHGAPKVRKQEALNAARLLKAERFFLNFKDTQIRDDHAGRLELVEVIRQTQPKLVLAPLWHGTMNHPDHLATGQLVRAACRYARFAKILPKKPTHTVCGLLHYPQAVHSEVDILIDVSAHVELWKELIRCHQSQLQTRPYEDWYLRSARHFGTLAGCEYAQGLIHGNPLLIDNLLHISTGTKEL